MGRLRWGGRAFWRRRHSGVFRDDYIGQEETESAVARGSPESGSCLGRIEGLRNLSQQDGWPGEEKPRGG